MMPGMAQGGVLVAVVAAATALTATGEQHDDDAADQREDAADRPLAEPRRLLGPAARPRPRRRAPAPGPPLGAGRPGAGRRPRPSVPPACGRRGVRGPRRTALGAGRSRCRGRVPRPALVGLAVLGHRASVGARSRAPPYDHAVTPAAVERGRPHRRRRRSSGRGGLDAAAARRGRRRAAHATPSTATTPPTSRCSWPSRPAARRASSPSCSPRELRAAGHRRVEIAGPGFLNITLERARRARSPADVIAGGRLRRTATRSPGRRSTSSSSRPTRPARCTSAAPAGPRSATRSAGCSRPAAPRSTREYYFNDAGAQIDRFARVAAGRGRGRAGAGGRLRGRLHRRRRRAGRRRASPACSSCPRTQAARGVPRARRRR